MTPIPLENIVPGEPDWTVLRETGVDEIAQQAARIVSLKYKDRAIGSLAEYDDMLQEARILLSTRLQLRVKLAIVADELPQIRHELIRDLLNIVNRGGVRYEAVAA